MTILPGPMSVAIVFFLLAAIALPLGGHKLYLSFRGLGLRDNRNLYRFSHAAEALVIGIWSTWQVCVWMDIATFHRSLFGLPEQRWPIDAVIMTVMVIVMGLVASAYLAAIRSNGDPP